MLNKRITIRIDSLKPPQLHGTLRTRLY